MRDVILFIVFFIVGAALGIGALVLAAWMIVWNVNDIAAVGANFWNVFWIMLVALCLFGGTSRVISK